MARKDTAWIEGVEEREKEAQGCLCEKLGGWNEMRKGGR